MAITPEERRAYLAAYQRAYRQAHLEAQRARESAYRQAHLEEQRAYRRAHREKARQAYHRWRAEHLELARSRAREYARKHPEKYRLRRERKRAALFGAAFTPISRAQWGAVVRAYGHRCAYCGKQVKRLEQDHVVPLCRGGGHILSNVVPACPRCNRKKWKGEAEAPPVKRLLL